MTLYLGIDGGGSKTTCVVGDEKSVLGRGTGSGSNVVRVGEARAEEALVAAIHQACAAANVSTGRIHRACVGMAGAGRPEVSAIVHRLVRDCVAGEVEVVGDHVTSLAAAFGEQPGIIVIAGTGSIAYGRNAEGKTARAGGWGFAVSDEGSGHWVGREAVAAALRARDADQLSTLLDGVTKAWNLSNQEQFIVAANSTPPPDFAALVPLIVGAADSGDSVAQMVLEKAGRELAAVCGNVVRRLFSAGEPVPVAMTGGVFRHCTLVRQTFHSAIESNCAGVVVNEAVVDPVDGALAIARKR